MRIYSFGARRIFKITKAKYRMNLAAKHETYNVVVERFLYFPYKFRLCNSLWNIRLNSDYIPVAAYRDHFVGFGKNLKWVGIFFFYCWHKLTGELKLMS